MKWLYSLLLAILICLPSAKAASDADQAFRDMENQISHAVMTANAAELNKLFADDYVSVGVSGEIRQRSQVVDAYTTGKIKINSSEPGKLTVRRYGSMAIVTGTITISGKEGGSDISGEYAFTRVYKQDDGRWRAVSFQATLVRS